MDLQELHSFMYRLVDNFPELFPQVESCTSENDDDINSSQQQVCTFTHFTSPQFADLERRDDNSLSFHPLSPREEEMIA